MAFYPPKTPKLCAICNMSFLPRIGKQRYCDACHTPCPDCGGKRDPRYARCMQCAAQAKEGKPQPWNKHPPRPIEDIVTEAESIGMQPDKQCAFGYIIGTVFGDGSVSHVTDRHRRTAKSGAVCTHIHSSYRIRLQVTDQWFIDAFVSQWKALTGRNVNIAPFTRSNLSTSTIKGVPEGYVIQGFTVSPRHAVFAPYLAYLKYDCDPALVLRFPADVLRGFLQGMIDAEGYTSPDSRTTIANKNRKLLAACRAALHTFGIRASLYEAKKQDLAYLAFSSKEFTKAHALP